MPHEKECPPAANQGASGITGRMVVAAVHSSLYRAEDGYQAPTAEDRREGELLAELNARGYRISVDCRACGHPLVAARSVAAMIGPKCLAKTAGAEAVTG